MGAKGTALNNAALINCANDLYGSSVTRSWATRFRKRHSAILDKKKGKPITRSRKDPSTLADTKVFVNQISQYEPFLKSPAYAVFDYDECRLTPRQRSAVEGYYLKGTQANQIVSKGNADACIVPFVNADGTLYAAFYVCKANADGPTELILPTEEKGLPHVFFFYNKTGNVNNETFFSIMDKFSSLWNQECCLFGDNLGAHLQLKTLELALQR